MIRLTIDHVFISHPAGETIESYKDANKYFRDVKEAKEYVKGLKGTKGPCFRDITDVGPIRVGYVVKTWDMDYNTEDKTPKRCIKHTWIEFHEIARIDLKTGVRYP